MKTSLRFISTFLTVMLTASVSRAIEAPTSAKELVGCADCILHVHVTTLKKQDDHKPMRSDRGEKVEVGTLKQTFDFKVLEVVKGTWPTNQPCSAVAWQTDYEPLPRNMVGGSRFCSTRLVATNTDCYLLFKHIYHQPKLTLCFVLEKLPGAAGQNANYDYAGNQFWGVPKDALEPAIEEPTKPVKEKPLK